MQLDLSVFGRFLIKEPLYQAETSQFFPRKLDHRIGYHRTGGTGDKADDTELIDAGEADGFKFIAGTPLHKVDGPFGNGNGVGLGRARCLSNPPVFAISFPWPN